MARDGVCWWKGGTSGGGACPCAFRVFRAVLCLTVVAWGAAACSWGEDDGPLVTWGDGGAPSHPRGDGGRAAFDAGSNDAGLRGDAGQHDAGRADAGQVDAGAMGAVDAGPWCICQYEYPDPQGGRIGYLFECGSDECLGRGYQMACNDAGQPVRPSCGPRTTCTCVGPGPLELSCGDAYCGGPPGQRIAYSCEDAGAVVATPVADCPPFPPPFPPP